MRIGAAYIRVSTDDQLISARNLSWMRSGDMQNHDIFIPEEYIFHGTN